MFEVFGLYIKTTKKKMLAKILIIFIPVFLVAYYTKNMVYILPTLAVGVMFGASINQNPKKDEEDGDDGSNDTGE